MFPKPTEIDSGGSQRMAGITRGPVSVVIVDDDPLARQALALMLTEEDIDIVGVCSNQRECIEAVTRCPPNVAIVDMQLGANTRAGIELIRAIRKVSRGTICAVLTATDTNLDLLLETYYAGAHGIHRKGYVQGERLPDIVKGLAVGEWEMDEELARKLLDYLTTTSTSWWNVPALPKPALTELEYSVLELSANGKKRQEIAQALVAPLSSIYVHIRNITDKIHGISHNLAVFSS